MNPPPPRSDSMEHARWVLAEDWRCMLRKQLCDPSASARKKETAGLATSTPERHARWRDASEDTEQERSWPSQHRRRGAGNQPSPQNPLRAPRRWDVSLHKPVQGPLAILIGPSKENTVESVWLMARDAAQEHPKGSRKRTWNAKPVWRCPLIGAGVLNCCDPNDDWSLVCPMQWPTEFIETGRFEVSAPVPQLVPGGAG